MKRRICIFCFVVSLTLGMPAAVGAARVESGRAVRVEMETTLPLEEGREYQAIARKVERFYLEYYDFIPPAPIKLIIARNEGSYGRVLQREGATRERALRIARSSRAISLGAKSVIVVCAAKNRTPEVRLRIITHEMFHQFQEHLGGQTPAHNWLREGSAKMAEIQLLEWSGEGALSTNRQNLIRFLAKMPGTADPAEMNESGSDWTRLVEQKKYPYQVAELMTDYLMRQKGKDAILRYFSDLRQYGNRETAFFRAFGVGHRQFVQDYRAYIVRESQKL